MAEPLLMTKLYIPPVPSRWVSRPQLIERLNDGLCSGHKLILISAPAGFGKTTLVSEWIKSREHGVGSKEHIGTASATPHSLLPTSSFAWLSLDRGDDDPARFWSYLIGALQSQHPAVGQEALRALESPQPPPLETVLITLLNDLSELAGHTVLVLDDLHTIAAQAVHDALLYLIEHLPPQMHVVVLTRVDPPWPLARLRARRQMTELRSQDLRFTQDQAAALLNDVMGLGLSDQEVGLLDARTEGWVAALHLAALSAEARSSKQGRTDVQSFIQALSGSHGFVLDYLIEEVLDRQPGKVQEFLLKTSILDRLSGPLCDAVTGGGAGQAKLERLERANLFLVPLDGEGHWYRYHRLFADLLQSRLQRTEPDLAPILNQRASLWCEQNGLPAEAIDHALAAGDAVAMERAADLVEQAAEDTLMRGEVATFNRWVSALPEKLVRAHPTLCLYEAWTLVWQSRSLKVIESLLRDAAKGGERTAAGVTALRGLLAGLQGEVSLAAELSRRALEQLPTEERFVRAFALWVLRTIQVSEGGRSPDSQALDDVLALSQQAGNVLLSFSVECNRAELFMRQGRLGLAAATYRRALDMATDAHGNRLPIAGLALIGLGELSREWGELDSATRYLLEGIRLIEQWTEVGPIEAYICLARIRWAQGDREGAWEAIDKAQELATQYDLTDLDDRTVDMFRAWLNVAGGQRASAGDLAAVQRWAEARDLFRHIDSPLQEEIGDSYDHRVVKYELLVLARWLIAQERLDEALVVLESLIPIAERRERPGIMIESYALQALAWQAKGNTDRALSALARAISLAEPEGYVRILMDEGEPMRSLIAEFRTRAAQRTHPIEQENADRLQTYADKLLAAWTPIHPSRPGDVTPDAHASRGYSAMVEALTEREVEVLRLLRTPLSLPEIADRLYISTNTVRSHAKHLYAKLDVHSRDDAVARAQEMGLI